MIASLLGDRAAVVQFPGEFSEELGERIRAAAEALAEKPLPGQLSPIAAYATLTIVFDRPIGEGELRAIERRVKTARPTARARAQAKLIEIPVRYGGSDGPDLEEVARTHGLTEAEVIRLHSEPIYRVHQIGFAPGFPYLGGLSPKLATPRLETPRPRVPAGSVGIGGSRTGIYPFAGPGGWRIIGRTETVLFDPKKTRDPSLLKAGSQVRFAPC